MTFPCTLVSSIELGLFLPVSLACGIVVITDRFVDVAVLFDDLLRLFRFDELELGPVDGEIPEGGGHEEGDDDDNFA